MNFTLFDVIKYIKEAVDCFPSKRISRINDGYFDDDTSDSMSQIDQSIENWRTNYFNKNVIWLKYFAIKMNVYDLDKIYNELISYDNRKFSLTTFECNQLPSLGTKIFFEYLLFITLKFYKNGIYMDPLKFKWFRSKGFEFEIINSNYTIEEQYIHVNMACNRLLELKNNPTLFYL
jgi:hypothetical protein